MSLSLDEKLAMQKQVRALETTRNGKRKALFEAQDEVDRKRDELIGMIENKLKSKTASAEIFRIGWCLE